MTGLMSMVTSLAPVPQTAVPEMAVAGAGDAKGWLLLQIMLRDLVLLVPKLLMMATPLAPSMTPPKFLRYASRTRAEKRSTVRDEPAAVKSTLLGWTVCSS